MSAASDVRVVAQHAPTASTHDVRIEGVSPHTEKKSADAVIAGTKHGARTMPRLVMVAVFAVVVAALGIGLGLGLGMNAGSEAPSKISVPASQLATSHTTSPSSSHSASPTTAPVAAPVADLDTYTAAATVTLTLDSISGLVADLAK